MKALALLAMVACTLSAGAQMSMNMDHAAPNTAAEKLGTVSFPVSCAAATQAPFNRGVALLHDFWYDEAEVQFSQIETADPGCAMAHWGMAMSHFHQIWNRPGEKAMAFARAQLEGSTPAKTAREREYLAALATFFAPGKQEYPARIAAYSAAMRTLYAHYPDDVDAGAFYALSLLAAEAPDDTSLNQEKQALAVLKPLFAAHPDHPGVIHYIIHACDNPVLAAEGLAASDSYGAVAASGAHAYHMPGHIYARLGMWPQDIASNLGSVAASESAEARHQSGLMDEAHSYDFLMYAYLQSAQDEREQWVLHQTAQLLDKLAAMPDTTSQMGEMVPYYRSKFPVFYTLEGRDWAAAAKLEPAAGASPEVATLACWARAIAFGHLRQAKPAAAELVRYDALIEQIKAGKRAYMAEGVNAKINRDELAGWVRFAQADEPAAIAAMREAADLQDRIGQGEVDIPAREMLADMLLEFHHPQAALAEYRQALKLSPNRFNGLYNAGLAAEAAGDKEQANQYYAQLMKVADNGAHSSRAEFAHVRSFTASAQVANR